VTILLQILAIVKNSWTVKSTSIDLVVNVEGGDRMRNSNSQPQVTHFFSYPIASADMFYSVENEREVCISQDPDFGFHIWGELLGVGKKSAVDLCDIFFEYALTCSALGDQSRTLECMESFAVRLGKHLAEYINAINLTERSQYRDAFALGCVMEAMHAHFTMEQDDTGSHYIIKICPICECSGRTYLPFVELVHFGFYKLCQGLIQELDPSLNLCAPAFPEADHLFSVIKPVVV
jgi:hypothetical protein